MCCLETLNWILGMPQFSVLGPIMFLLYTNKHFSLNNDLHVQCTLYRITQSLNGIQITMYANDITVLFQTKSILTIMEIDSFLPILTLHI